MKEVGVVSGIPAGTLADMALLSCDLCPVMWPAQEVWPEWAYFTVFVVIYGEK
jgi:hypothetical protein